MILKIQRSLFPPNANVLIYDESREIESMDDFDRYKPLFEAHDMPAKLYVDADIVDGGIIVNEVVEADW